MKWTSMRLQDVPRFNTLLPRGLNCQLPTLAKREFAIKYLFSDHAFIGSVISNLRQAQHLAVAATEPCWQPPQTGGTCIAKRVRFSSVSTTLCSSICQSYGGVAGQSHFLAISYSLALRDTAAPCLAGGGRRAGASCRAGRNSCRLRCCGGQRAAPPCAAPQSPRPWCCHQTRLCWCCALWRCLCSKALALNTPHRLLQNTLHSCAQAAAWVWA